MGTEWKNATVHPNDSIQRAIEVLESGAIRAVLVVDDSLHLRGLVTDGDIRRGLLRHVELSAPVSAVMNADPVTCTISDSKQKIISTMANKGLLHMPIVDRGRLVDFFTLQGMAEEHRHDNPVFLMAGGFGTRLRPLTNACPKPLLRLGNKPILETILENFVEAGFHRFYISTHYLPEKIRAHFGDGSRWGVSIEYVHEEEPLGTAGALSLLPDDLPELPLIMMNGDILTKVDFERLLDYHTSQEPLATVCVTEYENQVPYGVIESDGDYISTIVEKPVTRYFINAGIYVISPELRRYVPRGRLDMPDLVRTALNERQQVAMYPIHEYWLDIGRMPDFERAQKEFAPDFHARQAS